MGRRRSARRARTVRAGVPSRACRRGGAVAPSTCKANGVDAFAAQRRRLDAAVEHRGRRGWRRRSRASPRSAGSAARSRGSRRRRTSGRARVAGTIHRWTRENLSRPSALSGTSTVTVRSGAQSPRSQSCETILVPAASASRRGRSCRLTSGSRYIVTTVAAPRSVREQVLLAELDAVADAGGAGALAARSHEVGDDLDAEAARAEAARRGDDDAAVARAEVDDVVARRHRGELEHRQRHRRRGVVTKGTVVAPPRGVSDGGQATHARAAVAALRGAAATRRATCAFAPCGRDLGGHGGVIAGTVDPASVPDRTHRPRGLGAGHAAGAGLASR